MIEKPKFTPGPWGYRPQTHQVVSIDCYLIANGVEPANAALIAAAPEMLDALKDALELVEDVVYGGCVVSDEHAERAHAVRGKGYAALKKARGEV